LTLDPELFGMTTSKLPEPATNFARRHIGPSPRDIDAMLDAVGAKSLAALMSETLPGTPPTRRISRRSARAGWKRCSSSRP
jgi:glycine cleavage system pyridoxal-binding protein P